LTHRQAAEAAASAVSDVSSHVFFLSNECNVLLISVIVCSGKPRRQHVQW